MHLLLRRKLANSGPKSGSIAGTARKIAAEARGGKLSRRRVNPILTIKMPQSL